MPEEDSYTEVTSQSWFGRIGSSIMGVLVGILLLCISMVLLFWNEGRAVDRSKTLEMGRKSVISVSAETVNPANEGKLIHLTGLTKVVAPLVDSRFGITEEAIKLRRDVEMYQWKEKVSSEKHNKLGGGTETVKTYTYEMVWSPDRIDSHKFKKPEGHENPEAMDLKGQTLVADPVTVGAFTLSKGLVNKINNFERLPAGDDAKLPPDMASRFKVTNGIYYAGEDPEQPKTGDLKVEFEAIHPAPVSIVASPIGKTFEPFHVEGHGDIELLQIGEHSAGSMFQAAKEQNATLTWILRVVGFVSMLIGLLLIGSPIVVIADVIPIIGDLLGVGVGFFALIISVTLSLGTISIAWLVYRPLIGGPLLIAAIAAIVYGHKIGRQKKVGAA